MESRISRRVSSRQIEILYEFLLSNMDVAMARNRSLQSKDYSKRKWKDVAEILNAQGDGVHKDWSGWSKYWVDYKAKLKNRAAAVNRSQQQTGGGPSTEKPLTELEKKFIGILGNDLGQGLPGIRVEPFVEQPCSEQILPVDGMDVQIEICTVADNEQVEDLPVYSPSRPLLPAGTRALEMDADAAAS